jgi:hypothetical protein
LKNKNKDRNLKAARVKQLIKYKESSTKLSEDFSSETLEAKTQNIQSTERKISCPPRILCLEKLCFKNERKS